MAATCSVSIKTLLDLNRGIEIVTREVINTATAGLVMGPEAASALHRNIVGQFTQFKVSWKTVPPVLGVTKMRTAVMLSDTMILCFLNS